MGGDDGKSKKWGGKIPGLNPPRPHGRGPMSSRCSVSSCQLKSTPPAWAGTGIAEYYSEDLRQLKSTPPAWAGTKQDVVTEQAILLKSTPPAWAGTERNRRHPQGDQA